MEAESSERISQVGIAAFSTVLYGSYDAGTWKSEFFVEMQAAEF